MTEELPAGWQSAALRDIAEIVGGVTKDAKKSAGTGFREVPYLRVANVQRGWLDLTEVKLIAASEADIQKLSLLPGDILLNEGGDRDKLGRGWIWQGQLSECIHQNHVFRARLLSRDIEPVYVAHFTNSAAQSYFTAHGSQTTNLASISLTKLGSLPIRLPPAAEQTRIVAKLEELLSDLDAGVAELKAAQVKLQHYRQSLLKAAVEGSLTAAWRHAHPAPEESGADLLARILRERRVRWEAQQLAKFEAQGKAPPKGWQAKYVDPEAPATEDLPALPSGWAWASVEQIGEVTTGFTPATSDPDNFGGHIPFLKPTDLDAGYQVTEGRESLTEKGARAGRVLPAGSVLVTCIGATIGKIGFARIDCATNQQINAVSPEANGVLPEFVYWELCSGFGQSQIVGNASATTLPILNKSKFSRLPLMVPPVEEQRQIVQRIEAQFAAASSLQVAHEAALRQSTAQRQNLLRAAFAGQLVPQDPADEPAAELLARIRAERAAQGAAGKPRANPARRAKSLNSVERSSAGAVE